MDSDRKQEFTTLLFLELECSFTHSLSSLTLLYKILSLWHLHIGYYYFVVFFIFFFFKVDDRLQIGKYLFNGMSISLGIKTEIQY
jgi:hypothetical protein